MPDRLSNTVMPIQSFDVFPEYLDKVHHRGQL